MFSYPKEEAEFLKAPDSAFMLVFSTLHRVFEIPYSKSNSFYLVFRFYRNELIRDDSYTELNRIVTLEKPRRDVFNFMVKHHDINDVTIAYYFTDQRKRQQLEDYLDGKVETLVN